MVDQRYKAFGPSRSEVTGKSHPGPPSPTRAPGEFRGPIGIIIAQPFGRTGGRALVRWPLSGSPLPR
eukprot:143085-Hanusia_phi.AAC.2